MTLNWPDLTFPPINLRNYSMLTKPTTPAPRASHTQPPVSRIKQIQDEAYAKGYNQALSDIKAKIQEQIDKQSGLKKGIDKL